MEKERFQVGEKEAEEIINELYDASGYDFSNYSTPSIIRRFQRYIDLKQLASSEELFRLINSDSMLMNEFIEEITVNVTEMYRDPYFYKSLRELVLPELKNKNPLKIWHAGCSTGEEVYSMAILLKEQDLLKNSIIYGTDINQSALEHARKGAYNIDLLKQYEINYKESETTGDFRHYFEIKNGEIQMDASLREKLIFSMHNLVSDSAFNKFDLIVCRNTLIYFNKNLQNEVLKMFFSSLHPGGYLALGSKETILFSPIYQSMEEIHQQFKIWRKRELL